MKQNNFKVTYELRPKAMSKTEKPEVGAAESVGTTSSGLDALEDSDFLSSAHFLFPLIFSS